MRPFGFCGRLLICCLAVTAVAAADLADIDAAIAVECSALTVRSLDDQREPLSAAERAAYVDVIYKKYGATEPVPGLEKARAAWLAKCAEARANLAVLLVERARVASGR